MSISVIGHPHQFFRRHGEARITRMIRVVLRRARLRRRRRKLLLEVLSEPRDPRVLADIGLVPLPPSLMEKFPMALMDINR